jgi:hypothetical protein
MIPQIAYQAWMRNSGFNEYMHHLASMLHDSSLHCSQHIHFLFVSLADKMSCNCVMQFSSSCSDQELGVLSISPSVNLMFGSLLLPSHSAPNHPPSPMMYYLRSEMFVVRQQM